MPTKRIFIWGAIPGEYFTHSLEEETLKELLTTLRAKFPSLNLIGLCRKDGTVITSLGNLEAYEHLHLITPDGPLGLSLPRKSRCCWS